MILKIFLPLHIWLHVDHYIRLALQVRRRATAICCLCTNKGDSEIILNGTDINNTTIIIIVVVDDDVVVVVIVIGTGIINTTLASNYILMAVIKRLSSYIN